MAELIPFPTWLRGTAPLPPDNLELAAAALEGEPTLARLLQHHRELGASPVAALLQTAELFRHYSRWRLEARRLPEPLAALTSSVEELRLLQRLASRCDRLAPPEAAGALAALLLALKEGKLRPSATQQRPEVLEVASSASLSELPCARWLAIRRCVKQGLIEMSFELPDEAIFKLLVAHRVAVPAALASVLHEELPAALAEALDGRAQAEAFSLAATAYRGLLSQPPVQADRVVAFHVGAAGRPLGAVACSRDGELVEARSCADRPGWEEIVAAFLPRHPTAAFVLPSASVDRPRLARLRQRLGPAVEVRAAGLAQARGLVRTGLYGPRAASLAAEQQSALVLARRALQPFEEWTRLDPLELGLAEYQHDLDAQMLKALLLDVASAVAWERERRPLSPAPPAAAPGSTRLNPLIRSLADLRSGMVLDVLVTNITSFGAFVSFGLDTQGLIHISQLADERLSSPAQAVTIGQRLQARVIELDLQRQRVGFSLRREGGGPRPSLRSKGEALARLNRLFEKEGP